MSAKYSDCSESQPPSLSQITMRRLGSELAEANSKIQHLLDHCKDAKCSICAEIVCKHHEPLHFHHDGCPACEKAMTPEQIGNSWLENSSLEKWFPLTAEELAAARREIERLREGFEAIVHISNERGPTVYSAIAREALNAPTHAKP